MAVTFKYLKSHAPFADEAVRQQLYDRFALIAGPLSTESIVGFPSFPAQQLNDPAVQDRLTDLLRDLRQMAAA